ncbi:hypothetical protein ACP70R_001415 [Stipagrostis hirtigluma subsp. patula]
MDDATTSAAASSAFSGTSFVILSVSVVGILATTTLLLAYYLFLTRCGLLFFWRAHHHDVVPSPPPHHHIIVTVQEHAVPRRGLEDAAIRRMPTFRYRSSSGKRWPEAAKASECAVCLAEFRDGERLRLLPPCLHPFHIDCIDAWLQSTATCPLCRAAIASDSPSLQHLHIPTAAAGHDRRATDDIAIDISSVAMDAGGDDESAAGTTQAANARRKNSSMGGDERVASDGLVHQPMRRSLSMDSCSDKRFYLALQRILQQQQQQGSPAVREDDGKGGESSAAAAATAGRSRRLRRSFFSFSQSRGSRSAAVLPL